MSIAMHTWLEVDAQALRSNFQAFGQCLGGAMFAPVLKSNAYGHGFKETYQAIASQTPACICVNYVFEGERLRSLGYDGRVLVVGPTTKDEFETAVVHRLEIVMIGEDLLQDWLTSRYQPLLHVKFDTGMSRQGFMPEEAESVCAALTNSKAKVAGLCSHFANVEDVLEHDYANLQLSRLLDARKTMIGAGFTGFAHIASSASSLLFSQSRLDMCRVGISLYGLWPSQATRLSFLQLNSKVLPLKPALQWKTRVAMIKPVAPGEYIGYGCAFRAVKPMRVAVLPVGYNEGFPRLAGNAQSHVLVHGRRAPIVGRICMNMMMIDISHIDQAASGDEVVLIGKSGQEVLEAAEVAGWAQSIHYELLTRIHPEIPRKVIGNDSD